ncbi:MAG: hypothetical protein SGCHY_000565 [Lobulomycetales sp.]
MRLLSLLLLCCSLVPSAMLIHGFPLNEQRARSGSDASLLQTTTASERVFQVLVSGSPSPTLVIELTRSDSVATFARKIREKRPFLPGYDFRLVFGSKELNPNNRELTVSDYGITEGSTVFLSSRPPSERPFQVLISELNPSDSVAVFEQRIREKSRRARELKNGFRLAYGGKLLMPENEELTVSDYGITDGSTVFLYSRFPHRPDATSAEKRVSKKRKIH